MVKKSLTKYAEVIGTTICVRGVREYKLKKKQFLESSGIITIEEPTGLLITNAIISGKHNMKDVTDVIKQHVGQLKCPLEIIHIDTGMLNHFTGHDVEPGTQKLLQIEYITDDKTSKEHQICCPETKCKPKRQRKCCEDIDDTKYICLDNIKPNCEKKPCNRKCDDDYNDDDNEHCRPRRRNNCIRMSNHLYFPLYPIHGPFIGQNCHQIKCKRKCKKDNDC